MKNLATVIISMFISLSALAGSSNCSGVTHVTSGQTYTASSSDCIISIDKANFEDTLVLLPNNPSVGDKFVIVDNQSAEQCDDYGCWHASIGVETVGASIQIYDGYSPFNEDVLGAEFQQNQYVYDGTYWDVSTL